MERGARRASGNPAHAELIEARTALPGLEPIGEKVRPSTLERLARHRELLDELRDPPQLKLLAPDLPHQMPAERREPIWTTPVRPVVEEQLEELGLIGDAAPSPVAEPPPVAEDALHYVPEGLRVARPDLACGLHREVGEQVEAPGPVPVGGVAA